MGLWVVISVGIIDFAHAYLRWVLKYLETSASFVSPEIGYISAAYACVSQPPSFLHRAKISLHSAWERFGLPLQ